MDSNRHPIPNKWIRIGSGQFMICPKCCAGVFVEPYTKAVGDNGFRYCPYCGEDLSDDKRRD